MEEAFAKPLRSRLELKLALLGEEAAGGTLPSLSFDNEIFFGLEKSFILELLLLGSLSRGGTGGGGCMVCGPSEFGEGNGLLPLGKAAFAAEAAARRFPPSVPLLYGRGPPEDTWGVLSVLGCLCVCPVVLIGASPGYDRLRSLAAAGAGGELCIAACAAICDAVSTL